jgi:hypothetical protein
MVGYVRLALSMFQILNFAFESSLAIAWLEKLHAFFGLVVF